METGSSPENAPNQPISADKPQQKPQRSHAVREWVLTLAAALVVAWIIRSTVIEPFVVVGASMDPTFSTGQFLLVDRISYHFEAPKRDDVIVFKYPNDPSQDYIKRIIGLPGETVIISDGKVMVQAAGTTTYTVLNEPYVEPATPRTTI